MEHFRKSFWRLEDYFVRYTYDINRYSLPYLPGVDDGAPDMTVTKDMLDKMYDEGVRRIIATPHYRVGSLNHPSDQYKAVIWK